MEIEINYFCQFAEWILDGSHRLHFTLLPDNYLQFEVVQLISKV